MTSRWSFGATNKQSCPCSLRNQLRTNTWFWKVYTKNIFYYSLTYVWNSTHNWASEQDQGELPNCGLVCVVPVRLRSHCILLRVRGYEELEMLSLFFSRLSPPLFLPNCLSSPRWLFTWSAETIGSSCEAVKPSGTPLRRQHGQQMASIKVKVKAFYLLNAQNNTELLRTGQAWNHSLKKILRSPKYEHKNNIDIQYTVYMHRVWTVLTVVHHHLHHPQEGPAILRPDDRQNVVLMALRALGVIDVSGHKSIID